MLINALVWLINQIIKALGAVGKAMVNILPTSPFLVVQNIEIPYVKHLNWIIPVDEIIAITLYWLGAIAIYYVVQVILRWVKVIR